MSISGQPPIERNPGAQLVSWLELFYDLVFVATIVTFSEAATAHPDLDVMVEVIVSFAAVWWIWLVTTLLANRFPVDDVPQRALVLAQMLLLLLIALNVGDGVDQHEGFVSVAYALLCLDVAVMYARHDACRGRHRCGRAGPPRRVRARGSALRRGRARRTAPHASRSGASASSCSSCPRSSTCAAPDVRSSPSTSTTSSSGSVC